MPTSKGIILAIDQGTTSSRAMAFDSAAREIARAQAEFPQIYPRPGEVEHDPERIWIDTLALSRRTIEEAQGKSGAKVAAIGITNQRETTIVWERATGKVLHNAIVWQDRRTAPLCDKLRADGLAPMIQEKTGLVLDPYFSATKLAWILEHIPNGQARASRGELAFGTIDSFLLWRLTGGKVHATDASNAARTMLFNIRTQSWDDDLLKLFHVPRAVLPDVRDSSGDFGATDPALFGASIAIRGIAGDQQAATFGQAAFEPGMVKSTYGTGCFLLANTGERLVRSQNRLLSTVAWRLKGRVTYAVEGAIFVAGAAVQWVRDGLRLIGSASESEALARSVTDTGGVYLVPAFTGLGAPYWDADARGALLGLTRATGAAEIARATLESIAYQTRDLTEAMAADGAPAPAAIRVDGGLVANNFAMQFLADMLGTKIERPVVTETTALGAAYLAGMACGVYGSQAEIAQQWRRERLFEPAMDADQRMRLYNGWKAAISRVRST